MTPGTNVRAISAGKSGNIASQIKPVLTEQHHRLQAKHGYDMDLIDDLKNFIKTKCDIEKHYAQGLIKLTTTHQKKYPSFEGEKDSDDKSLYTAWRTYLDELDRASKHRLAEFEQIAHVCDTLKEMQNHKKQMAKKTIDQHLRRMQDEMMQSVNELDKQRKAYHEEEHFARQARDKEEKLKKKKAGIFSKLSDLQTKKEKTSSHREASEIQSTAARNEYIMALAAANAHFHHLYSQDIPSLQRQLDDDALEKCKDFILKALTSDMNSVTSHFEAVKKSTALVNSTSSDVTNLVFLTDPASNCIREEIQIEFEPCDGDSVTTVSTEHNADLALQHEVTKWLQCFQKECRNLNRLANQLVKCQNLVNQGHKTVEVRGVGVVNLETQIDEVRQQIRKCDVSKCKAYARLTSMKEGGMPVQDLEAVEEHIRNEMKVSTLEVDSGSTLNPQPLSRTASMKSTNVSEGRSSAAEMRTTSETEEYQTPEPDRSHDVDSSDEERPAPSPAPASYGGNSGYDASASGWTDQGGWDDPTAAWTDDPVPEPPAPVVEQRKESVPEAETTEPEPQPVEEPPITKSSSYDQYDSEPVFEDTAPAEEIVDGTTMVGKIVRAMYPYPAQNADELDIQEGEELTIVNAVDRDWVTGQNLSGQVGYVPAAYLEVIGDAPPVPEYEDVATTETDYDVDREYNVTETEVMVTSDADYVRALYDYEATSGEEISFNEGDMIRIIERSEDGWWTGELNGVTGHFPSMLVSEMEEEGEDEEEEVDEEEEEEGAFEGSDAGSVESAVSNEGPSAPPPSFAPPKPLSLVPQQIVIMQPTPEIESKGTFGEEIDPVELEDVSRDDGIGEENSDLDNDANQASPPKDVPPPIQEDSPEGPSEADEPEASQIEEPPKEIESPDEPEIPQKEEPQVAEIVKEESQSTNVVKEESVEETKSGPKEEVKSTEQEKKPEAVKEDEPVLSRRDSVQKVLTRGMSMVGELFKNISNPVVNPVEKVLSKGASVEKAPVSAEPKELPKQPSKADSEDSELPPPPTSDEIEQMDQGKQEPAKTEPREEDSAEKAKEPVAKQESKDEWKADFGNMDTKNSIDNDDELVVSQKSSTDSTSTETEVEIKDDDEEDSEADEDHLKPKAGDDEGHSEGEMDLK